jgi:pimeloyl-ACP methyl ester carboxylesterase
MPFFEHGDVRIHYETAGSGFPLLIIPGGGLNSDLTFMRKGPFDPMAEFSDEYRCVAGDLRHANGGQSRGPLEPERPWDAFADDQLALMDHLGCERFIVMGFCIGGPMTWNLLKRAGDRIAAAVIVQPSGSRPEQRDFFYQSNSAGWGPAFMSRRPEVGPEEIERFLTRMYRECDDFVFTVSRDFVRQCQTPVLILPDDIPAHPYAVAMESAMLAPNSEVSLYPWKEPSDRIALALRHIRSFMRVHRSS